jgi:hypothetical protein
MKQLCTAILVAILAGVACNGDDGDGNGPITNGPSPTNPVVSSINPTSGVTNGGTSVTVTGSRFVNGATLTLGGVAATGVQVNSATSIVGTTAARTAGQVDVVVRNPNGESGTLTGGFTYTGPTLVANPGGPYLTRLDQNLVVSGINSTSSPFPIAVYRWDCGQLATTLCLRDTPTPTTTFKYHRQGSGAQGTVTLRLIVIDTAGNASPQATTQVTITNSY